MESGFKLDEEGVEKRIGELSDEFAQRVGALADLFSRWREPEVARTVIEALISGDGKAFRELGDVDLPNSPVGHLRLDRRGRREGRSGPENGGGLPPSRSPLAVGKTPLPGDRVRVQAKRATDSHRRAGVIQPGPFLEALKAANLVNCVSEWPGGGLELVIGKPQRMCV